MVISRFITFGLLYTFFLVFTSTAFATDYYKVNILSTSPDLVATGRLAEYETGQFLDNDTKKASLLINSEVVKAISDTTKNRLFNSSFSDLSKTEIEDYLKLNEWLVNYTDKTIYKYLNNQGCKNFKHYWRTSSKVVFKCPVDAAKSAIEYRCTGLYSNCQLEGLYTNNTYTNKIDNLSNDDSVSVIYARYTFDYNNKPTNSYIGEKLNQDEEDISEINKIYITDLELANLILKNKQITTSIFTPLNTYELTNNTAYKLLHFALKNSSNTTSDDTSINPDKDENGENTGGWKIPEFCDWAKPVCNFIDWMKEEVTGSTDTEVDIQQSDIYGKHNLNKTYLEYEGGCPPDYLFDVTIFGYTSSITISYSPYCDFIRGLAPYLKFISYIAAAFIVAGVRNA